LRFSRGFCGWFESNGGHLIDSFLAARCGTRSHNSAASASGALKTSQPVVERSVVPQRTGSHPAASHLLRCVLRLATLTWFGLAAALGYNAAVIVAMDEDLLKYDEVWPPPAERGVPLLHLLSGPSRWSYPEQSRAVELSLRQGGPRNS
jgi:hypothetical protein